ncbi:hypothetical protein C8J56DRAFT_1095578 [Mycena floridula]|nr:hypothetical protein C8J56DRAFT_1095578 [Mycena floridula]
MLFSNIAATTLLVAAFSVSATPVSSGEASGSGFMNPKDMMLDPTGPGGSVDLGWGYKEPERQDKVEKAPKRDNNKRATRRKYRATRKYHARKKAQDPDAYKAKAAYKALDAELARKSRAEETTDEREERLEKKRVYDQRKRVETKARETSQERELSQLELHNGDVWLLGLFRRNLRIYRPFLSNFKAQFRILGPWARKGIFPSLFVIVVYSRLVGHGSDSSLARHDSKPDFPPAEMTIGSIITVESTWAPHWTWATANIGAETLTGGQSLSGDRLKVKQGATINQHRSLHQVINVIKSRAKTSDNRETPQEKEDHLRKPRVSQRLRREKAKEKKGKK